MVLAVTVAFTKLIVRMPEKYIGKTGRTFKAKYKEHVHITRNNRPDTRYSEHIVGISMIK
jgi:hypothetical protein